MRVNFQAFLERAHAPLLITWYFLLCSIHTTQLMGMIQIPDSEKSVSSHLTPHTKVENKVESYV